MDYWTLSIRSYNVQEWRRSRQCQAVAMIMLGAKSDARFAPSSLAGGSPEADSLG